MSRITGIFGSVIAAVMLSQSAVALDPVLTGTPTSSGEYIEPGYDFGPAKAFDGDTGTESYTAAESGGHLKLSFASPQLVTAARLYFNDNALPVEGGKIYGSVDGNAAWVELGTVGAITVPSWVELLVASNKTGPYRAVRYVGPTGSYTNIAELSVRGLPAPGGASQPGGSSSGNAANCYWLLGHTGWTEDFTIIVHYQSGHTVAVGVGDYLPVGCNVGHYEVSGGAVNEVRGLRAYAPACNLQNGWPVESVYIWVGLNSPVITKYTHENNPNAASTGWFGCDPHCPSCQGTPTNNPHGDDDNDGVRNECDPDFVPCVDQDQNGVCDICGDNWGTGRCVDGEGGLVDADNDGICDECDPDAVDCEDADDNGCCDHCNDQCEVACEPGGPTWPECCYEDSEHSAYPLCGCQQGSEDWPSCCESDPDHPLYSECGDDCNPESEYWPACCSPESEDWPACCHNNPTHPGYPTCGGPCECGKPGFPECCQDDPEHPLYPDCECEDPCKNCNPCEKLDVLIRIMRGDDPLAGYVNTGVNPVVPTRTPPPNATLGGFTSGEMVDFSDVEFSGQSGFTLPIPLPGRSPLDITVGLVPSGWAAGGQPLLGEGMLGAVEAFRGLVRAIVQIWMLWLFAIKVFGLLFRM